MTDVTPLGKLARNLRFERGETLGTMAQALGVTSAYLSAVEHGKKPTSDALVKKIHIYFKTSEVDLEKWKLVAEDSQPQIKLDLGSDRDLKLKFGRTIDDLSEMKKKALRELLEDGKISSKQT